jgi:hypothetical protein
VPVDKLLVRLQNVKKMEIKGQVEIGESDEEIRGANPLEMLMSDASDEEEIYNSSSSSRSEKLVS